MTGLEMRQEWWQFGANWRRSSERRSKILMVLLLHKFWQFSIQLFLTIKYVKVVHPLCWPPDAIHVVQCSSFIWAQCCSTWFSVFPAVHHILHRGSSCSNCSEYRSSFATLVWHCLQTASVVVHHFTLHQLLFITDRCSSQLPIRHHSPILFVIGSQCDPVSSSIILTLNLPPQLRWDCGRIVNCAGIETIAILISATFVNTALSTVNLKGLSNYIVHCLGGLSPMSLRCVGWLSPMLFHGVGWSSPMSFRYVGWFSQCRSVVLNDCSKCMLDDHRIEWIVHCAGLLHINVSLTASMV